MMTYIIGATLIVGILFAGAGVFILDAVERSKE